MSAFDIPVNVEASDINGVLNSVVLFVFLMGMYTVIYFGTLYVSYTKNPSKYHPVPAAITILYLGSILYTALQWYLTKWQLVNNHGDTRQSVFLALFDNPQWINIALNVSNCITFTIADGLLIWRCFHAWNRSLRVIAMSLFLLLTEFTLFLVQIAFNIKYTSLIVPAALSARLDALFAAAYFISFATTLLTTGLISYRIYSVSKHQGASLRRFKHIIDIVVQSGAVYAVSQLAAAISFVLPGSISSNTSTMSFVFYIQTLSFAVAGISTTIMVARVTLLSADTTYPSTAVHVSDLRFQAHATHPTLNMEATEIEQAVDGDRVFASEGQAVEEKIQ